MRVYFHEVWKRVAGAPGRVAVLSVFLRFPEKGFTGREVAREAGLSQPGALKSLKVLEANGVITRARIGHADHYRLQRKHFLVQHLRGLARLDALALESLKTLIRRRVRGTRVEKVVLFGSLARGEERPTSDIDVLFVVPAKSDKREAVAVASEAGLEALDAYGSPLAALVHSRDELRAKKSLPLFQNMERDGIVLYERRRRA